MKKIIILHFVTCCISLGFSMEEHRIDRMFSLFNVVKFKNSECQAVSSTQLQGVCYTETECKNKGGTSDGNCAAGFGVCCVFRVNTCPGTVTQNGTFLENPKYPTAMATAGACVYTVNRLQADICQIRLDFTKALLYQPVSTTGVCSYTAGAAGDTLAIVPGATNLATNQKPPTLCGKLTGHHLYIDAGISTINVAATVTFSIGKAATQYWRVKVSQIECSSRSRAPAGCLQYFMGTRNTVTSFNWDGMATCTPTCELANQDYTVCFRREKGMCSMQFAQTPVTTGDSFHLDDDNTIAAQTSANCANSYVQIPGVTPQATFAATAGIFCDGILASYVGATQTNIIPSSSFKFRHFAGGTQNTLGGFSIDASQAPC